MGHAVHLINVDNERGGGLVGLNFRGDLRNIDTTISPNNRAESRKKSGYPGLQVHGRQCTSNVSGASPSRDSHATGASSSISAGRIGLSASLSLSSNHIPVSHVLLPFLSLQTNMNSQDAVWIIGMEAIVCSDCMLLEPEINISIDESGSTREEL